MKDDVKLPFRDVRADQPLTDGDFAVVRKAVLAKVQSRHRGGALNLLYPAIATCVVAILMIVGAAFVVSRHRPVPAVVRPAAITDSSGRGPSPRSAAPTLPPIPAAAPAQDDTAARSAAAVRPPIPAAAPAQVDTAPRVARHHQHPAAESLVAATEGEPLVIQLQTSNPDIRIIWITR